MIKYLLSTALLLVSTLVFAQNEKIITDQNAQKRSVNGFHAVRVSNGIDLYLSQGEEAVAVSAADIATRDRIKTEVQDGVLKIYIENEGLPWNWNHRKMKAYVSFKMLDDINASGGSDVYTESTIKMDKLGIRLSGGSDLKATVEIRDLNLHQSGGSDVNISGSVANLKIEASGGSDFHGYELASDYCVIEASGGSDMRVRVNKELDVNASGGSDVYYKGDGVIKDMHSSGSSSITKKI